MQLRQILSVAAASSVSFVKIVQANSFEENVSIFSALGADMYMNEDEYSAIGFDFDVVDYIEENSDVRNAALTSAYSKFVAQVDALPWTARLTSQLEFLATAVTDEYGEPTTYPSNLFYTVASDDYPSSDVALENSYSMFKAIENDMNLNDDEYSAVYFDFGIVDYIEEHSTDSDADLASAYSKFFSQIDDLPWTARLTSQLEFLATAVTDEYGEPSVYPSNLFYTVASEDYPSSAIVFGNYVSMFSALGKDMDMNAEEYSAIDFDFDVVDYIEEHSDVRNAALTSAYSKFASQINALPWTARLTSQLEYLATADLDEYDEPSVYPSNLFYTVASKDFPSATADGDITKTDDATTKSSASSKSAASSKSIASSKSGSTFETRTTKTVSVSTAEETTASSSSSKGDAAQLGASYNFVACVGLSGIIALLI
ncbi:hypothetical protein B5S28_g3858 [[Candida] boidinii]|uniref:Unnamed protein product n=1 Tax=Candida boidinii TaxID=5477 RepID=A0ACB5TST1_CANBO|nr:hypothetical protein B5S28_g3858 [[Candida] boidinii]OWB62826.1 hypothetical protein B5S29_g3773 [[Candida] boidinii]GME94000.1 unnamed protein product [[Candida] boidinii]